MNEQDRDLRERLGGLGVEVPAEFRASVACLDAMGRGVGSISARLLLGSEAPQAVRYLCIPFNDEGEAMRFVCELIQSAGYGVFLDLAPLAVRQTPDHCLVAFLGVPCVTATVH